LHVKRKKLAALLVALMMIGLPCTLYLSRNKNAVQEMNFQLLHDSDGNVGIPKGEIKGRYNASIVQNEDSVIGSWMLLLLFDSHLYYKNFSFAISLGYDLDYGHYSLNHSCSVSFPSAQYDKSWTGVYSPGFAYYIRTIDKTNITYASPVGNEQTVKLKWHYNLTAEEGGIGIYGCSLRANLTLLQESGGVRLYEPQVGIPVVLLIGTSVGIICYIVIQEIGDFRTKKVNESDSS